MKATSYASVFLFILISGCGNNAALDQSSAADLVVSYLKSNPVYDTEKIELGMRKFKSNSDKKELAKFKELADKGYVDMNLQDQKKKFLSKDSTYFYHITLTDKSKPFVLKQVDDEATLKVMEYQLDEDKEAMLDKVGNKTAKVTVMLKKVQNAFSVFYEDKNTSGGFVTKTYKLKYSKETGWLVTGN